MAIGTGASARLGIAVQSAYGTAVAPTHVYEFNTEGLKPEMGKSYSRALNDRYQRSTRVRTYVKRAAGNIDFTVLTKGMGLLYDMMLGTHAAAVSADGSSGAAKDHVFSLDDDGLAGLYYTVQVDRPAVNPTTGAAAIKPYTFVGGKMASWSLSAALDQNVMLSTTWDFKTMETDEAAISGGLDVYPDAYPFGWDDATIKSGTTDGTAGTSIMTKSVKIDFNQSMNTDRRFLGGITTKREPLLNGETAITGAFELEFEDGAETAYVAKYIAGTTVDDIYIAFALPEAIDSPQATYQHSLIIKLPTIEFTSDVPVVGSSDVLSLPVGFKALYNGTDLPISITMRNDETTYNAVPA